MKELVSATLFTCPKCRQRYLAGSRFVVLLKHGEPRPLDRRDDPPTWGTRTRAWSCVKCAQTQPQVVEAQRRQPAPAAVEIGEDGSAEWWDK